MNMQPRFTPVEERENQIHMQQLQHQAEQERQAQQVQHARTLRISIAPLVIRAAHTLGHGLWVAVDEVALDLVDLLHGHRPHVHHHRHAH